MRTAEIIIKEYLEQGYSLAALRALADSRSEPLRSAMSEILDRLDYLAAQTAPVQPAEAAQDDVVFFIAEEEETADCEAVVDFNLMAEDTPAEVEITAASEESVADIVIGETDGSEMVALPEAGIPEGMVEAAEAITDTEEPVMEQPTVEFDADHEETIALAPEEMVTEEMIAEQAADYLPTGAEEPVMEEAMPEPEAFAEPEAAAEPEATLEDDGMDVMAATASECIPAPVMQQEEIVEPVAELEEPTPMTVAEEQEAVEPEQPVVDLALAVTEPEQTPEPTAAHEETLEAELPQEVNDIVPAAAAVPQVSKQESRRERRRRNRAEKKKMKKQKREHDLTAETLPEIILAQSEGTDTLVPEQAETAPAPELIHEEQALLETAEPVAEQLPEPVMEEALEQAPEPVMEEMAEQAAEENTALETTAAQDEEAETSNNIIVFRTNYPVEETAEEDEEEAPRLRMLTFDEVAEMEEETAASDAEPETAMAESPALEEMLSPMARIGLLRAFTGHPEAESADESYLSDEHIIFSIEPDAPNAADAAIASAAREEMEQAFQQQLDNFAARLLEVQTIAAEREKLASDRKSELDAKEAELASVRETLAMLENAGQTLRQDLDEARAEDSRKQAKINEYADIMGEYERLYKEFEDLRLAYNEVVIDVMPALQNERDDLALTVERQCESEGKLRSSLGSARKRLAVGYSLGAAACAMLVALPVFNWLRSGYDERELAFDRQRVGELREQLEKAEMRNLESEKHIFNLERKVDLQLAELNKMTDKRTMESAMSRNGVTPGASGTPIRVSDMALAGPMDSDGLLRYNDVRDPAGSIDSVVAMNRSRREAEQAPAANSRVAVSSRARTPANSTTQVRQTATAAVRPPDTRTAAATTASRQESTTAKVKAGEGVAQVVYRVLGTRSPQVIDWVIRENNIKKDRRGNPRIYPDQELRLPKDGKLIQSASR